MCGTKSFSFSPGPCQSLSIFVWPLLHLLCFSFLASLCVFACFGAANPCRPISGFKKAVITGLVFKEGSQRQLWPLSVSDWLMPQWLHGFALHVVCALPWQLVSFCVSFMLPLRLFSPALSDSPTLLPTSRLIVSKCLHVISWAQSRALGTQWC